MKEATEHLAGVDHGFARIIDQVGPIRVPPPKQTHFASLVRAIVFQQLAGRAAETIHGRLCELLGDVVEPERLIAKSAPELRLVGISNNKFLALYDLSERFLDGKLALDPAALSKLDDEAIIRELCEVRGIGPWTAQMFLLSQLRRPNVWPTGDLGVRRGYSLMHEIEDLTPVELELRGEILRPFRSIAALYCWSAVHLSRAK